MKFLVRFSIRPRLLRCLLAFALAAQCWEPSAARAQSPLLWNGNLNANWDVGTTANWLLSGSPVVFTNGASVLFADNAAGPTAVSALSTVQPAGFTVSNYVKSYSFSGAGTLTPTAGLTKFGTNRLTLMPGTRLAGTGTFAVGGGEVLIDGTGSAQSHTVTGDVWVGHTTTAAASLVLSNAVLTNTSWLAVGRGNGTNGLASRLTLFNSTQACANLALGYWANVSGNVQTPSLTLNGASRLINTGGTGSNIGESTGSSAQVTINDSSWIYSANRVLLGMQSGATGTLVIANSGRLTNGGYASIGAPGVGSASLRDSSIWQALGDFNVADTVGSQGTLQLQDNAQLIINTLYLGKAANSTGIVYQTGGTIIRNAGGDWRIGGNTIGATNQHGAYYLTGGTLNAAGANLQIGARGIGFLNQSGGVVNVGAWPVVGRYPGSTGVLNVFGGTFNQTASGNSLIIGEEGTGTLILNGNGVVNLANSLRIGSAAGAAGTVNLNGGTLITKRVYMNDNAAASTFNFNGGILRAAPTANANFLTELTAANILAGGAIIDSGTNSITIAQALSGSGSLTKLGSGTLVLGGVPAYTGSTFVSNGTLLVISPNSLAASSCLLAPGTAFGVQLGIPNTQSGVASLTVPAAGAILVFDFRGFGPQSLPPLSVTNLVLNGTSSITVAGIAFTTGQYPLLRYGARVGAGGFVLGSVPAGMVAHLVTNVASQTIDLNITTVPETLPWQLKQAPVMTDWAQQVDPKNPWPEYPRPQMQRTNWLNLNGVWQWQPGNAIDPLPSYNLAGSILVPFCMESAISGVMEHHDRAWYKRTFTLPPTWAGQRILLHFEAVDWECEPFLNGVSLGVHRGGYDPFTFDVTPYLTNNGAQTLIVRVYDPTDATGGPAQPPLGKQRLSPSGIWYTSCSGIWQTVWVEPVPATSIADIHLVPDIDQQRLKVNVSVAGSATGIGIQAVAFDGSNQVASASGTPGTDFVLSLPAPRLWSPTNPFLYDLRLTLTTSSNTLDAVTSYFGMRKISLGTNGGFVKMFLNNQFMFQFGPLDQGYWPDGIYTPPTDLAMREDIEQSKALGFNFIRKHVKVEPRRWYYYTDKLGLVVWQDMPSMATDQPVSDPSRTNFEAELSRMITTHWNSPSIIVWTVFNEGWGQYDTVRVSSDVMALDPSRLVNCASGWTYYDVGHMEDSHSYPDPSCPQNDSRAVVNGEFGGVGLGITNHTWASGWGYIGAIDGADLTAKFEQFCYQLSGFVEDQGLSAAVYTQITDVETELNGLYTYDRQVLKPDLRRMQNAIVSTMGVYSNSPFVATSQNSGQDWKYTFSNPGSNWQTPGFSDSSWTNGQGGFGTTGTPGAVERTTWNTADIWLRRSFNGTGLTPQAISNLVFSVHHDEDVEIYLNGVLAASAPGYTTSYGQLAVNPAAQAAIVPGPNNILAVHCHQTGGGQYIDVGIDLRTVLVPPPAPFVPNWVENGTGLTGEYFTGINLASTVLQRTDTTLNFNWSAGSPAPGLPANQFSARWSGRIQPRYTEVYTFHLTADDGCRLWINGQLLIDKWSDDSATDRTGTILLTGGQRYDLVVEYYENAGNASIKLEWTSASQLREVVPQGVLFLNTPPVLSDPAWVNGRFQMLVSGESGRNYSVYACTNVAQPIWLPILSTNPPAMPFLFVDPSSSNAPERYYRAWLGQ